MSVSDAPHESAVFIEDAAGRLGAAQAFGAVGIGQQAGAVALVGGEVGEIDQAERRVGRARDLGGQVVADIDAAAAFDRLAQRLRIGLEVGELVGVERVEIGRASCRERV